MRPIDADELKKELGDTNMDIYTNEVKEMIDQQPTIDTERHGHWINIGKGWYRCSNCNEDNYIGFEPQVRTHKYCINCGAKMDEVIE